MPSKTKKKDFKPIHSQTHNSEETLVQFFNIFQCLKKVKKFVYDTWTISCECFISIPPENSRKTLVFWRFHGV